MNTFRKSAVRRQGARSAIYNLAAIALLVLLNFALAASAPLDKADTTVSYDLWARLDGPPPCPEEKKLIIVTVMGEVLNKNGETVDLWPVPGLKIDMSEPKLGVFTEKDPMSPFFPSGFITGLAGNGFATYEAKETGRETIKVRISGTDLITDVPLDLEKVVTFNVRHCWIAPIFNLFAKADSPEGSITAWGAGGGEARIDDEGKISGDGELGMAETIGLPEQCTPVESSGQAPFTISGDLKEETINLQFDFSNLTLPPATSTCTARGVSIPLQVLPGSSGDPGAVLGFHELSTAAGGGTTSFPYPVAGYSGGTTVVVTLIREEPTASGLDPFAAIDILSIWSPK